MKYLLLLTLLLGGLSLFSQSRSGNTRAVVIGISDYQDPLIPDLNYAHRDAIAFASWLRSPAGGSLPKENLLLHTNEAATNAEIIMSLNWLIEESKKGDRAFIYFSGHGDVERVSNYNNGYLLGYDSPPAVYGAGAFAVNYLKDIIASLSDNGVQVFMISDACRAGKLAGSSKNGSQVTAARLSQQFAKEIKILSCQPDEFSIEGEQWGGGRGLFSYHLENALYGFADQNEDLEINLLELGRYLQDKVSTEADPESQIPMVQGPPKEKIAFVDDKVLAQKRAELSSSSLEFLAIDNKGLEEMVLADLDSNLQIVYEQFLSAIDSNFLMAPVGSSANDYYETLMASVEMKKLHGTVKRKFVVALMDEGQQMMNRLLKTDQVLIQKGFSYTLNNLQAAEKLERAAYILGEGHFIYNTLKSKEYFFRSSASKKNYLISSENEFNQVKSFALKALSFDNNAAYTYVLLAEIYKSDSLQYVAGRIDELTPGWAYGHSISAFYLARDRQYRLSLEYTKKAIAADSSYLIPYWRGLNTFVVLNQFDSTRVWRTRLGEKVLKKVAEGKKDVYAIECLHAGISLMYLRRFKDADILFQKGSKIAHGSFFETGFFSAIFANYIEMGKFTEAISLLNSDEWIEFAKSNFGLRYFMLTYKYFLPDNQKSKVYFHKLIQQQAFGYNSTTYLAVELLKNKSYLKADSLLNKSLAYNPNDPFLSFYLTESKRLRGDAQTAEKSWLQILDLTTPEFYKNQNSVPNYLLHLIALHRLGQTDKWKAYLRKGNKTLSQDRWFHYHVCCFYAMTEQPKKAMEHLIIAETLGWEPTSIMSNLFGTVKNPMLDPLRNISEFKLWEKRWFPPYADKK